MARPIDQKAAWIENVVPEMWSRVCNELLDTDSAKLQSFPNDLKRSLGEYLTLTARQCDQFGFRR